MLTHAHSKCYYFCANSGNFFFPGPVTAQDGKRTFLLIVFDFPAIFNAILRLDTKSRHFVPPQVALLWLRVPSFQEAPKSRHFPTGSRPASSSHIF